MSDEPASKPQIRLPPPGAAFLLSQLGFESARRWAERIAPLGIEPRQGLVLRVLNNVGPTTQADLARRIRVPASKVVGLVDELEAAGLAERRSVQGDRRVRAIHLTDLGAQTLGELAKASAAHEKELTAGLSAAERRQLVELLEGVADELGLTRGIHPGVGAGRRR
ncbi:MAG TPA: MarR family transcriptional regulator [Candidatus Limnocylindrales bacterium]|nr:MarR family transcriptional regulator [Candidatus Limnocylindrales bacterium]